MQLRVGVDFALAKKLGLGHRGVTEEGVRGLRNPNIVQHNLPGRLGPFLDQSSPWSSGFSWI